MADKEKICSYSIVQPAALLQASGEDAPAYLQSQFSNDLCRTVVENACTYGLWLDQKGKTRADSFVLQTGPESYLLLSYYVPAGELREIVEGNIIADEVEIEDLTAKARLVSFWGGEQARCLLPAAGTFEGDASNLCFAGRRNRANSGEILIVKSPEESEKAFFDAAVGHWLKNRTLWAEVDLAAVEAERIRAGIPAIPQDIGPGELPQEGGLEVDAVAFNKGCYLGQEVMARLHAMGRAQRALYRVSFAVMPDALPCPVFTGEKQVGELRSAFAEGERCLGLALLKRRAAEGGEALHLQEPQGPLLEIQTDAG